MGAGTFWLTVVITPIALRERKREDKRRKAQELAGKLLAVYLREKRGEHGE